MARYNFGEKKEEYSPKAGKNVPVWQSPKYEQTKRKVIEMLESDTYKGVLEESDFWILMNATKSYTIRHFRPIVELREQEQRRL